MYTDPLHEAIQRRAYELYEQRGREHGRDWQDWFQAEREVLSRFQADTVIRFGPTGLIDAADWTLARLAELGVNLPPGNRLQAAKTLITRVNNGQVVLRPDDDRLLDEVSEAQWTIMEQYVILRGTTGTRPLTPEHLAKLQTMLSGAATASVDANPQARNTQFELYVGATLAMGGARVTLEEPDLIMEFLARPVGVAAKRVRSITQFRRRVDEAVEQIRRSGRPGFVAVSVEVLVKNTGAPSAVIRLDQRLAAPLAAMDAKLRQVPEVFASIVFGRDTRWIVAGEQCQVEVGTFVRVRTTPAAEALGPQAQEFLARLLARIRDRQHTL